MKLLPKVVDTVLNGNVFATRVLSGAKRWMGERIKCPVKYAKNTTGGAFSGFDTFATSATDNRVNLEYVPKFYKITVALPLDELSANQTEQRVLDLASLELQSASQDMADEIGTLFYGNGTSKEFLGLGALIDDGTNAATIGGLSRTTYPTLKSTVTASSGVLTLAKMSTLYSAITSGAQKPTMGLCSESVFNIYEALLQANERIVKEVPFGKGEYVSGTGFTGLYFKGFPILSDEKATAETLFFVNEDFIDWYALPVAMTEAVKYKAVDIKGNDYSSVMGLGFSWSGWIKPTNSASIVSHIYLGGELTTSNPKRHGKLTGITS